VKRRSTVTVVPLYRSIVRDLLFGFGATRERRQKKRLFFV
jgi:hypothetical protein